MDVGRRIPAAERGLGVEPVVVGVCDEVAVPEADVVGEPLDVAEPVAVGEAVDGDVVDGDVEGVVDAAAAVRAQTDDEAGERPTADSAITRKQALVDGERPVTTRDDAVAATGLPTSVHAPLALLRCTENPVTAVAGVHDASLPAADACVDALDEETFQPTVMLVDVTALVAISTGAHGGRAGEPDPDDAPPLWLPDAPPVG